RTVVDDVNLDAGRGFALYLGKELAYPAHDLDGVGAGLAVHREIDGAVLVHPARVLEVLDAVLGPADIGQAHRHSVRVGDDQIAEAFRPIELAGRLDRVTARCTRHDAGR